MTENNAAQPGLTDDQIEALAKKHICPHHDRLDAVLPNRVPYQQTEQFRRVKALIGDVLSKLRAEGVHAGEPVADEHEAKQVAKWKRSSELLDAVQDGCWDVRFLSSPNGDAGDFSIGVEIVSHFMAAPRERVIGENWNENLRAAIEQAMTADGYPPARPERASAPVAGEAQPTDEQILNIADRVWREHEQVPTDKSAVLALVREVLGKAPVADESPMAKMADALREKGRQEQQAYQDSRVQSTEWGPMPHGTEADLPASAPVAGEAISDKRLWLMMAPWHLQMLRAHELRDVTEFGRAAYAAGMADAAPQASALAAEYALGRADGFDAAKAAPQTSPVAGEALQVATRAMQLISRKALDEFDRQQHDKLIQDFAALHERHFAAPQASEAVRNADQDEMERLGWVNIGYKHDLEKARRAISFCNIPGFDTMSLDNAIYWLRANADKDGGDCAKGAEDVAMRDAAFEAVRKQLCKLPRYSFLSDAYGAVRLVGDRSGNWIEFNAAHALLDPVSVDAALSPTPPVVKQSLTATQTGEKGDSDAG